MKISRVFQSFALLSTLGLSVGANAANVSKPRQSSAPNPWILKATLSAKDNPLQLGYSVGMSGNTIVATGGTAIYVYEGVNGDWGNMSAPSAELRNTDAQYMYAVAISGNTVVAGSTQADGSGAAYVFVKPASGWKNMTQTAKLTGSDAMTGSFFGGAVAIAGNTIVVGATENNSVGSSYPPENGPGAVYVFLEPAEGWSNMTETAKLTASDGVAGDDLGYSVVVQGDTIAASAPNATIGSTDLEGALYVFQKDGSEWRAATQTAKLTASDGHEVSVLGMGLSLNGNTLAAAAFDKVYVYTKSADGWMSSTQSAELVSTAYASEGLNAVGLSRSYAVAGSPYNNVPFVDIYLQQSSGWTNARPSYRILAPTGNGDGSFGWSIATSPKTFVVGSPLNGGNGGNRVYLYQQK